MNIYPHFTQQILLLKGALKNTTDKQKIKLLNKWIEQLEAIDEEVVHLEKIEGFASKLTENK